MGTDSFFSVSSHSPNQLISVPRGNSSAGNSSLYQEEERRESYQILQPAGTQQHEGPTLVSVHPETKQRHIEMAKNKEGYQEIPYQPMHQRNTYKHHVEWSEFQIR